MRSVVRPVFTAVALLAALSLPGAQAQSRLRVLISVDMEGVAGTVTGDQLGPTGFEYGRFRDFMTREALAHWYDAANRTRDALRGPLRGDLLLLELLAQWR